MLLTELCKTPHTQLRPFLTNLNGDSSWLISLPRPAADNSSSAYFHILLDPWLSGPAVEIGSWFSHLTHIEKEAFPSISAVHDLVSDITDTTIREGHKGVHRKRKGNEIRSLPQIDAVIISHNLSDHMHKETLLQVSCEVPVFAVLEAASTIRTWNYFSSVLDIPDYKLTYPSLIHTRTAPLPDWLSILRVSAQEYHPALHYGIMIAFSKEFGTVEDQGGECILYSPHGIQPCRIQPIIESNPGLRILALLHGLDEPTVLGIAIWA
ncbi:uncharacterized protein ATNIH1004_010609 [Aspergillus tanneri]|uniref:Metallo-beta-lactamase domain-containing protein n=1 Tax=Aspergillus tanneri TaxID=1220188 RepID=A0A5M9MEW5_9EURO|nr:uncharacterized protein ATNIH1004_010609 [Aspergillus tanneri]KAA8643834.1 hypothetical protein ATNIH1004_010609 [Aspergillus tanneri]